MAELKNIPIMPAHSRKIVCLYIKVQLSCESLGTNFPKSQSLVKDCQFADPLVNYSDSVTVSEVAEIHNMYLSSSTAYTVTSK